MKAILHSQCASSFYVPCHFYIMHVLYKNRKKEQYTNYKSIFSGYFNAVNLLTEERDDHNPE